MQTKFLFRLILSLVLVLEFSSCSDKSGIPDSKYQIKDDLGIKVGFDSVPRKIISLAPNITEALFAIGADSLIAGVTDLCDYPDGVKNKSKMGNYLNPDYEKISSVSPDLILMYVSGASQPSYQALKNLNMKLFVCNPVNTNDIIKMINNLGRITGRELKAQELSQNLVNEREKYFISARDIKKESCLIVVSVNPLMTASGKTFIHEITELSGLDNLYKDESLDYPMISYEDVTAKNPAFIILPCDTTDEIKYNNFISELSEKLNTTNAVKDKKIILADDDVIFRPGPRFLEGVKIISSKLQMFR